MPRRIELLHTFGLAGKYISNEDIGLLEGLPASELAHYESLGLIRVTEYSDAPVVYPELPEEEAETASEELE